MNTGIDVRISDQAVIRHPDLVTTGDHVAIDPFVVISTQLELGSYVHIACHCSIIGGRDGRLEMGDFSCLAAGCRVICSTDDYVGIALNGVVIPAEYRSITVTTVRIKKYASIATNVVLLPGVTVGEGAVAGVGTVVNKDLEPWGVYLGNPARRIGTRAKDRIIELSRELCAKSQQ